MTVLRTLRVYATLLALTLWHGTTVIVASLLGVRGRIYRDAARGWSRGALRASGTPVIVHGLEHVPADRSQVVVSNHVSWYDIFAIAGALPGEFHFVAKKELEAVPLFGAAWQAAGHISIDRRNRESAIRSLRVAGERVRRERSTVVIFAEGTRSRTGRLLPFKKGAFMLAVEAQVPIVPTAVVGSYDIMRPDSLWIHPRPIHLFFGEPVSPEGHTLETVEALMERVRDRVAALLAEAEALPPVEESPVEHALPRDPRIIRDRRTRPER